MTLPVDLVVQIPTDWSERPHETLTAEFGWTQPAVFLAPDFALEALANPEVCTRFAPGIERPRSPKTSRSSAPCRVRRGAKLIDLRMQAACRDAAEQFAALDLNWWTCTLEEVIGPALQEMRNIHVRLKPTPWIASDWRRRDRDPQQQWGRHLLAPIFSPSYAVTEPRIEKARWLLQCCQRAYEL